MARVGYGAAETSEAADAIVDSLASDAAASSSRRRRMGITVGALLSASAVVGAAALRFNVSGAGAAASASSASSVSSSFASAPSALASAVALADDDGSSSSSTPLSVTMSNYYEREVMGYQIADGDTPWKHLVQINKETQMKVDYPTTGCDYEWSMSNSDAKLIGDSVEYVFMHGGYHTVSLTETCTSAGTSVTLDLTVMCKWVRYEIRTLTEDDRNQFFDALEVVYKTKQEMGQKLYGKKFRSAASLVKEHLNGAADKMCDHW